MATTGPPRWPGAATFPNTNEYPGQGNVPFIRCRISFDGYNTAERVWHDVSARLRSWQVSRGRQSELQAFDAGTATLVLDNRDRFLDPGITAGLGPLNKVWLSAEFSGEVHDLFVGYAETYVQDWPDVGFSNALATIRAADEFKGLARINLPSSGTRTAVTVPALLNALLDTVSINRAPRVFQAGLALTAYTSTLSGQPLLAELQLVGSSDVVSVSSANSLLFVTASGELRWLAGNYRTAPPYNSPAAVFGDAGGSELPYSDCQIDYSDSFLFNSWTVNGANSSSETASDAASINTYGVRPSSRTVSFDLAYNPSITAAAMVNKYKEPLQRITAISPLMGDLETMRVCFGRELGEQIEVLRTAPGGGGRIDQLSFIENISWQGEPGNLPSCTFGVSPR